MKVFVTGASGWIGSAVVPELLGAGHAVVGLARSDESAARLEAAGASVVRADLNDTDALAGTAAAADGVIHLAFQHEVAWSGNFDAAGAADRAAVEAIGQALAGSNRPFLIASGIAGLGATGPGGATIESDGLLVTPELAATPMRIRHSTGLLHLSLAGIGVRASILRFPPTVHGDGDHGFVHHIVSAARARGVAGYVGHGDNRWAAVHVSDAARLTRLALESAPAGSVLHAIGDRGVRFADIASAIGTGLGVPAESITPAEALEQYTFLGPFVALDMPARADITRDLLGWEPTGPSLLDDLAEEHYFK